MLFIFQNKGVLVPVFWIVSLLVTALVSGELKRNVGGIFNMDYSILIFFGLGSGTLIAGILSLLFGEDHVKNNKGEKVKINVVNSFFFIKMKWWGYILISLGSISVIYGFIKIIMK